MGKSRRVKPELLQVRLQHLPKSCDYLGIYYNIQKRRHLIKVDKTLSQIEKVRILYHELTHFVVTALFRSLDYAESSSVVKTTAISDKFEERLCTRVARAVVREFRKETGL